MYYKQEWATLFLKGYSGKSIVDGTHGETARSKVCIKCVEMRGHRCRILQPGNSIATDLHGEPFASAPVIYSYNVPKYFTVHLRAEEFAKAHGRALCWMHARDVPLFDADRELPPEQLHNKLAAWVQRHVQDTAHISGMFPLVPDLPVRAGRLQRSRRGL